MNTIVFTQTGVDALKKEQEELKKQRKDAVADLKKAREMGDLSENGYYKAAKFKLGAIDRRIRMVTHLLRSARVPHIIAKDTIDIGAIVTLDDGKEKKQYVLVGGYESNPAEGKLSIISPMGKALIGRKSNDVVYLTTPTGEKKVTITSFSYLI